MLLRLSIKPSNQPLKFLIIFGVVDIISLIWFPKEGITKLQINPIIAIKTTNTKVVDNNLLIFFF